MTRPNFIVKTTQGNNHYGCDGTICFYYEAVIAYKMADEHVRAFVY